MGVIKPKDHPWLQSWKIETTHVFPFGPVNCLLKNLNTLLTERQPTGRDRGMGHSSGVLIRARREVTGAVAGGPFNWMDRGSTGLGTQQVLGGGRVGTGRQP